MIKEKIKTKKRSMSVVALLIIVIVLAVSSNISIIQAHAYTNESTDYETQYYELSPILEKNFMKQGSLLM